MLRCAVLKHPRGETYRGLEFALRDSLSARRFARLDEARAPPRRSALQATVGSVEAETWERINRALLSAALADGVETGERVRIVSTGLVLLRQRVRAVPPRAVRAVALALLELPEVVVQLAHRALASGGIRNCPQGRGRASEDRKVVGSLSTSSPWAVTCVGPRMTAGRVLPMAARSSMPAGSAPTYCSRSTVRTSSRPTTGAPSRGSPVPQPRGWSSAAGPARTTPWRGRAAPSARCYCRTIWRSASRSAAWTLRSASSTGAPVTSAATTSAVATPSAHRSCAPASRRWARPAAHTGCGTPYAHKRIRELMRNAEQRLALAIVSEEMACLRPEIAEFYLR